MKTKEVVLTGARPTGQLHIGNYLGAIKPIIDLSEKYSDIRIFAATLHSFTDQNPSETIHLVPELVKDYIASGVNLNKVIIFDQMYLSKEIALATLYLSKMVSAGRLMNIPTLKDKIKGKDKSSSNANALLLQYPILMSADIILQRSSLVPVGIDQSSHLEFCRDLVDKFNKTYKCNESILSPKPLIHKELNILSLRGGNKMSKTDPSNAVFLGDSKEAIIKKILSAETSNPGEMSKSLNSLLTIGKQIGGGNYINDFLYLEKRHLNGEFVMKNLKDLLIIVLVNFVKSFSERRLSISDEHIYRVIKHGSEIARCSAIDTLELIEKMMLKRSYYEK